MHSILFLAADPTDASRLRLGKELREIQEKLQLAKLRNLFTLNQRMSVQPTDLSQALLDLKPEIVHFSGHGMSTGELCFEDETGTIFWHRLKAAAAQLVSFTQQTPDIRIIETEGDPPTKYVFEFRLKGVTGIDGNHQPIFSEKHIVEDNIAP